MPGSKPGRTSQRFLGRFAVSTNSSSSLHRRSSRVPKGSKRQKRKSLGSSPGNRSKADDSTLELSSGNFNGSYIGQFPREGIGVGAASTSRTRSHPPPHQPISPQNPNEGPSAALSILRAPRRSKATTGDTNTTSTLTATTSTSTLTASTNSSRLLLSNWGLPEAILQRYHLLGVHHMFQWQADCLSNGDTLNGRNLVFSAPTSAGKTMVAEILIFKTVLETKKKAIMILPFVSVAHEKVQYFKFLCDEVGIRVGGFLGSQAPRGGFECVDIAVCTIEKGNSLVNRLLEARQLHKLGILVVDELHMLGDSNRGYLLELMLTKILFVTRQGKSVNNRLSEAQHEPLQVQVVGMSATLPNLDVIARWLDAFLYTTNFRPVPLTECIKVNGALYSADMVKLRDLKGVCVDGPNSGPPLDEDTRHIVTLCLETVACGQGVLIFCPTKRWCETLADNIARVFYRILQQNAATGADEPTTTVLPIDREASYDIKVQLERSPAGLDFTLGKTVQCGVAYHHAGLTFDEREILESAFRVGVLKVLVATSTLSSGVNLPARRVIIRNLMFYNQVIDPRTYKQMVGRAGRKGIDTEGESILMCKGEEKGKAVELLNASLPPITSSFMKQSRDGGPSATMKRAILEIIVSGTALTASDVALYSSCTLQAAVSLKNNNSNNNSNNNNNNNNNISNTNSDMVSQCVEFLTENQFISLQNNNNNNNNDNPETVQSNFFATQLGSAVLASALSPDEGLYVFAELQRARRCFVLENELHILYLVTPIYSQDVAENLNWYDYYCLWERLDPGERRVAELVGVEESFFARAIGGRIPRTTAAQLRTLNVHRRFYTCLCLNDLVHEMSLSDAAKKYGCTKGQLQSLQQSAATFAGMVTVFCGRLGWTMLESLLSQFQSRLTFGVQLELCDLMRVSLLNGQQARLLFSSGYASLADLAIADSLRLEHILQSGMPFQSNKQTEDETEWEAVKRLRKSRCIWLHGCDGMTAQEAALRIIKEAKRIIEDGLGGVRLNWEQSDPRSPQSITTTAADPSQPAQQSEAPNIPEGSDSSSLENLRNSTQLGEGSETPNAYLGPKSSRLKNPTKNSTQVDEGLKIPNIPVDPNSSSLENPTNSTQLSDGSEVPKSYRPSNPAKNSSQFGKVSTDPKIRILSPKSCTLERISAENSSFHEDSQSPVAEHTQGDDHARAAAAASGFTDSFENSPGNILENPVFQSLDNSNSCPSAHCGGSGSGGGGSGGDGGGGGDGGAGGDHSGEVGGVALGGVGGRRQESVQPTTTTTAVAPVSRVLRPRSKRVTPPPPGSQVVGRGDTRRGGAPQASSCSNNKSRHSVAKVTRLRTVSFVDNDHDDDDDDEEEEEKKRGGKCKSRARCHQLRPGFETSSPELNKDRETHKHSNPNYNSEKSSPKKIFRSEEMSNNGIIQFHDGSPFLLSPFEDSDGSPSLLDPCKGSPKCPSMLNSHQDTYRSSSLSDPCKGSERSPSLLRPSEVSNDNKPSTSDRANLSANTSNSDIFGDSFDLDTQMLMITADKNIKLDNPAKEETSPVLFSEDKYGKFTGFLPPPTRNGGAGGSGVGKMSQLLCEDPYNDGLSPSLEMSPNPPRSSRDSRAPSSLLPASYHERIPYDENLSFHDCSVEESDLFLSFEGDDNNDDNKFRCLLDQNNSTRDSKPNKYINQSNEDLFTPLPAEAFDKHNLSDKEDLFGESLSATLIERILPEEVKKTLEIKDSSDVNGKGNSKDNGKGHNSTPNTAESPKNATQKKQRRREDFEESLTPSKKRKIKSSKSKVSSKEEEDRKSVSSYHADNDPIQSTPDDLFSLSFDVSTIGTPLCLRNQNTRISEPDFLMSNLSSSSEVKNSKNNNNNSFEFTEPSLNWSDALNSPEYQQNNINNNNNNSNNNSNNNNNNGDNDFCIGLKGALDNNNAGNNQVKGSAMSMAKPSGTKDSRASEENPKTETPQSKFQAPPPPPPPPPPTTTRTTTENQYPSTSKQYSNTRSHLHKFQPPPPTPPSSSSSPTTPISTINTTTTTTTAVVQSTGSSKRFYGDPGRVVKPTTFDDDFEEFEEELQDPDMGHTSQRMVALCDPSQPCSQVEFTIIDVCCSRRLFDTFVAEWRSKTRFAVSVGCERPPPRDTDRGIGANFMQGSPVKSPSAECFIEFEGCMVVGVAVCWGQHDAYYVALTDHNSTEELDDSLAPPPLGSEVSVEERLEALRAVFTAYPPYTTTTTTTTTAGQKKKTTRGQDGDGGGGVVVVAYDAKATYRALTAALGVAPTPTFMDPKVAAWLLDPGAKESNFHGIVFSYLPSVQHLLDDVGGGYGYGSVGLTPTNSGTGRRRSSIECVLVRHLMKHLEEELAEQHLEEPFVAIETPLTNTVARMELNGFGFSVEESESQKAVLQAKMSALEEEAYSLAGHTFSLSSPEDISKVLYLELQLPVNGNPNAALPKAPQKTLGPKRGRGTAGLKSSFSTTKAVLEKLKSYHQLPRVVLEWRQMSNSLTKVVFPLTKAKVRVDSVDMHRVHSICQMHTATGRISMLDPNLQNIPKDFHIKLPEVIRETPVTVQTVVRKTKFSHHNHTTNTTTTTTTGNPGEEEGEVRQSDKNVAPFAVSMRNAFIPFEGGVLVAADYSQLELRIIAHLSGDQKLIAILNQDCDVFKLISSQWKNIPVEQVSHTLRQQAKQICYGMLYGIGAKALSETLEVDENHASVFMESFKSKYPGMKSYIERTVRECRQDGFVRTISGRKRFLPNIHSTNQYSRLQAERQAVNTTVQGSAADLMKVAMVNIDRELIRAFPASSQPHSVDTTRLEYSSDGRIKVRPLPRRCSPRRPPRRSCSFLNRPSGAYLLLQIHDELIYEVGLYDQRRAALIIQSQMENAMALDVRLPVKLKCGPSWGKLQEYCP